MKLADWQAKPIECAAEDYIKYVIPNRFDPDISDETAQLMEMADGNFYDTLCLFFETGAPDPRIQDNLDNGIWTTPKEVIRYIEAAY